MSIFTKIEQDVVVAENWVKEEWSKLDAQTKLWVPVTINILNGVKAVMDSPVDNAFIAIIDMAVPNAATQAVILSINNTVKNFLPKAIAGLTLTEAIANIADPNAQLQAILAQLKLSSNATQNAYLHSLSAMILQDLHSGLTWGEAVQICQYYYDNKDKLAA